MEWIEAPEGYEWFREIAELVGEILDEDALAGIYKQVTALRSAPPPVQGPYCEPVDYIPPDLERCRAKLRRVVNRLAWLRNLCALQELSLSGYRRRLRALEGQVSNLREENAEHRLQYERARQQIQSLLKVRKRRRQPSEAPKGRQRRRGAPKGHRGHNRPVPDRVDKEVIKRPPRQCPDCGGDVQETDRIVDRYVEDIPPIRRMVTKERYIAGRCDACGSRVYAAGNVSGPQVRVGPNLITTLTLLRQQSGVTHRKLSRFATESCGIKLSPAGVEQLLERVGRRLAPAYAGIEATLPEQAILHADETGWKVNGQNWQLWVFCNESLVYFHPDPSRAAAVPASILTPRFPGLLITDFYGAYNRFPNTQKCLVHLLRDIKAEQEIVTDDDALTKLEHIIKTIAKRGTLLQGRADSPQKQKQLDALIRTVNQVDSLRSKRKKTQTLIKRARKYRESLLAFIHFPGAAWHNNLAERSLRPMVIHRKISFGNRTPHGALTNAILASVIETARRQEIDAAKLIYDAVSYRQTPRQIAKRLRLPT